MAGDGADRCVVALLLLGVMAATPGRAASFDCAKAENRVERLICSDPSLSALDDRMAIVYHTAAGPTPSAELRRDQNIWRRQRDKCSNAACVSASYEQRIASLGGAAPTESAPTGSAPTGLAPTGLASGQAGDDRQGKFCIFGPGNAYSMLLLRPAGLTKLQFALTDWAPNGSNFSVAGIAVGSAGAFRFESGMASPDPTQHCGIGITRLADGGYSVTLQANAGCEAMGGHNAAAYLADRYPAASRVGDAPAVPDMDALDHTGCTRNEH